MGLAFIGTLCSDHSVGVVQVTMVPLVIWLLVMFATKEFDVSQSVGPPLSCRVIHLDSTIFNFIYTVQNHNRSHLMAFP